MITIKNITKSFDDKTILYGISAEFYAGKTNLIIGQSGSGKTVLMKSLIGLVRPEKGEINYGDRNILMQGTKELRQIRCELGMLFQGSALFDSMTVMENVMFPLKMFTRTTLRDRQKRAQFCLDRVGLAGAGDRFPSEISGGMQKRVAIARAISLNPKYLFCDEPNSGLDPKTSLLIDELLMDITHEYNMTTIINTHDMNSVLGIGENILYLNKGHKEWVGNKDQVFTSDNENLIEFVFASNLYKAVRRFVVKEGMVEMFTPGEHLLDAHND